jgi:hypothetical protein
VGVDVDGMSTRHRLGGVVAKLTLVDLSAPAALLALAAMVLGLSGPLLFGPFGLLVVGVVRARMRLEAGDGGSEALFA